MRFTHRASPRQSAGVAQPTRGSPCRDKDVTFHENRDKDLTINENRDKDLTIHKNIDKDLKIRETAGIIRVKSQRQTSSFDRASLSRPAVLQVELARMSAEAAHSPSRAL